MELHEITVPAIKRNRKRLGKGHGSGHGGTSSKGHKGAKARKSGNIPAWFEGGQMPLQRRLPKRGFKNIFRVEYRVINLERLAEVAEAELNIDQMEVLGLIPKATRKKAPVKVLAGLQEDATFTKKIHIKANAFSKAAKELIEKNGGVAEVV